MDLCVNDEMKWMFPHHSIHCTGVSFTSALGEGTHVQVYGSKDGTNWDLVCDTALNTEAATTGDVTLPCRSKAPLAWLKLCVRRGNYSNVLKIQGIVQSDS